MKLDQKYFELIRNYLKNKPVKKAYLFGSFSTGNEMPESDIDILVDLDYTKP
jgi:predicted nucleotidyltransferase